MVHATEDPETVRQLESVEHQLASAWTNRDCAAWGAFLADDWSVTHIDGQVMTKLQALEMCRSGPPVTAGVDQLVVRSYGDTAVVSGRTKATLSGTDPQTVTLRFTDVFVRRAGRWYAVASHATRTTD